MASRQIKTRKAFDEELAKGRRLALFYSAWCPFCTSFLPEFDSLAGFPAGALIKISTDDLPELEDLFAIEVVPTVLYFSAGKPAARLDGELGRGLTAAGLKAFALRLLGAEGGR